MAEYRTPPRITKRSGPIRLRRLSNAFYVPGSGDSDITVALTGNATFEISDVYGDEYFKTGTAGTFFNFQSTTAVNGNVTLSTTTSHNLGDYVACNSNAGAFTITLPAYTERLQTGSWIGFYDSAGMAKEKVVSVNPDTVNTTYTINGSSASKSLLDTNYGSALLFYVSTNTNWVLLRAAGAADPHAFGTATAVVNTNHTVAEPERTILVTTGGSDRTITLPDATDYVSDLLYVVKIDSGAGNVILTPGAGDTINGDANTTLVGQYRAIALVSDGADWYIISEREATARFTKATSAGYTVAEPINVVLVTTAANTINIELPVVSSRFYYDEPIFVKKVDSGAGIVTVNTADSANIDGAATQEIHLQYQALGFANDGTDWHVIADRQPKLSNVTSVNTDYSVAEPKTIVLVTTSTNTVTIELPNANTSFYSGEPVYIKKVDSSTGHIVVNTADAATIDGGSGIELWGIYSSAVVASDNTNWHVLA
jgi:hypothetical protein